MLLSLPWPRAMVTGCLMSALGVAGHTAAGGAPPSPVRVVFTLILASMLARTLQGRPGCTARVGCVLLVGQLAVHLAMTPMRGTAGQHHVTGSIDPMQAMHATGGHPLRQTGATAWGPQLASWIGEAVSCLLLQPTMLLLHAVAAAAVGAWLAVGERAAHRLAKVLEHACLVPLRALPSALPVLTDPAALGRAVPASDAPPTRLRRTFLVACTTRRGPPVPSF